MGAFQLESKVEEVLSVMLPNGRDWSLLIRAAGILAIFAILICAIRLGIALIQGFRLYVIAQLEFLQPNFKDRYGEWAVVTGAAHGIGLAFAKELAARGMSIVLIDIVDLGETKALIEATPNVGQVNTLQVDLADSTLENFDKIRQYLNPDVRNIGILINNAGLYPFKAQKFQEFPMSYHLKLANLNMLHPLHMTHMIVPGMIKRGRGMVMNISSIATFSNLPYMGIYSPSKSFVATLTRQLQAEYASEPIDLILLTPGPITVYEPAKKSLSSRLIHMTPGKYVRTAINAAATGCNEYSGTMQHGLLTHLVMLMNIMGLMPCIMRTILKMEPEKIINQLTPNSKKVNGSDLAYYQQRLDMEFKNSELPTDLQLK